MPRVVGLTGGIASGKSTVASYWRASGVTVIDADAIAREVVTPGHPALFLIRRRFGRGVLRADGTLDRAALGALVFGDARQRAALNRRTHPFIVATMLARLARAVLLRWESVVVLDTPLLFETGALRPFCSRVVVVSCGEEEQVARMVRRDGGKGVGEEEARKRLASQMPMAEKVARADVVIDNSGGMPELEERAREVLNQLFPSAAGELVFRGLVISVGVRVLFRVLKGVCSKAGR